MTKLSINLNKFALVRNSRGTDSPNVLTMGTRCVGAGAHGLTIHPRPDQRHATYQDAYDLGAYLCGVDGVEFNVEGNPGEKFLSVVKEVKPDQCTLVPDAEDQLTSDHGWDLVRDRNKVIPIIASLKDTGIRVSLFMDAENLDGISIAKDVGADRVELYTEPYAKHFGSEAQEPITQVFTKASEHAQRLGLDVNAGHDLSLDNLSYFLTQVPYVLEVSIGHALVIESWTYGLENTVAKYIDIVG